MKKVADDVLAAKLVASFLGKLSKSEVTYAQFMEDHILSRYLWRVVNGFYVDVGCNDPDELSVTKYFYEKGWRGINIDPLPNEIAKYARRRPRDTTYCRAVSDHTGRMDLFGEDSGATLNEEEAQKRGIAKSGVVRVDTLSNILDAATLPDDIHFLKIDVENHEREVLAGIDFQRHRPWMMVVEATLPTTSIPCHDQWEHILLENGYVYLATHEINRYYCAQEKREELVSDYLAAPVRFVLTEEQHITTQWGVALLLKNI